MNESTPNPQGPEAPFSTMSLEDIGNQLDDFIARMDEEPPSSQHAAEAQPQPEQQPARDSGFDLLDIVAAAIDQAQQQQDDTLNFPESAPAPAPQVSPIDVKGHIPDLGNSTAASLETDPAPAAANEADTLAVIQGGLDAAIAAIDATGQNSSEPAPERRGGGTEFQSQAELGCLSTLNQHLPADIFAAIDSLTATAPAPQANPAVNKPESLPTPAATETDPPNLEGQVTTLLAEIEALQDEREDLNEQLQREHNAHTNTLNDKEALQRQLDAQRQAADELAQRNATLEAELAQRERESLSGRARALLSLPSRLRDRWAQRQEDRGLDPNFTRYVSEGLVFGVLGGGTEALLIATDAKYGTALQHVGAISVSAITALTHSLPWMQNTFDQYQGRARRFLSPVRKVLKSLQGEKGQHRLNWFATGMLATWYTNFVTRGGVARLFEVDLGTTTPPPETQNDSSSAGEGSITQSTDSGDLTPGEKTAAQWQNPQPKATGATSAATTPTEATDTTLVRSNDSGQRYSAQTVAIGVSSQDSNFVDSSTTSSNTGGASLSTNVDQTSAIQSNTLGTKSLEDGVSPSSGAKSTVASTGIDTTAVPATPALAQAVGEVVLQSGDTVWGLLGQSLRETGHTSSGALDFAKDIVKATNHQLAQQGAITEINYTQMPVGTKMLELGHSVFDGSAALKDNIGALNQLGSTLGGEVAGVMPDSSMVNGLAELFEAVMLEGQKAAQVFDLPGVSNAEARELVDLVRGLNYGTHQFTDVEPDQLVTILAKAAELAQ